VKATRFAAASFCIALAAGSAGAEPVKLNPPLVAGGDVIYMEFSPDGQWIVYRAMQESSAAAIYRVPRAGGAAVRLSPTGSASSLDLTPDGSRVLYRILGGGLRLESVPLLGGSPATL